MKNTYKLENRVTQIKGALLHGDGPTFRELLEIDLSSFGKNDDNNKKLLGQTL